MKRAKKEIFISYNDREIIISINYLKFLMRNIYFSMFSISNSHYFILLRTDTEAYVEFHGVFTLKLNTQGWTRIPPVKISAHRGAFFSIHIPQSTSRYQRGLSDLSHGAWSSLKDRPASERAQTRGGRARCVMKSARIWNAPISRNARERERECNSKTATAAATRRRVGSSLSALPRPPLFAPATPLCSRERTRASIESSSLCSANCLAASRRVESCLRSR